MLLTDRLRLRRNAGDRIGMLRSACARPERRGLGERMGLLALRGSLKERRASGDRLAMRRAGDW